MQGTGAVNLAAVLSGVRATGVPLPGRRLVVLGAGRRHRRRRPAAGRPDHRGPVRDRGPDVGAAVRAARWEPVHPPLEAV
ncbi:malic enzyme-like NAD(P)-binding protein [Streptomyces nogalater]|uniref:Malic enzyme-like NAD(P)-binding protein n=1 Tax=Streptomyces nogalater TaxID=38314 RepID=A0ABW0WJ92_STRNO